MPNEAEIMEVKFSEYRQECINDAIFMLKEALIKAEKSEITSVALAYTFPGGGAGTETSKTDNVFGLLGAIELLRYRLVSDVNE